MSINSTPSYLTIQLSKSGRTVLISPEDSDLIQHKWHDHKYRKEWGYVVRSIWGKEKPKTEYMHRIILARMIGRPLEKGECCDHINGCRTDNRRENLRIATRSQNMHNRRKDKDSLYKGVQKGDGGRWRARIEKAGKQYRLGTYDTPEEAHAAYCEAAKLLFGEFARFE